MRSACTRMSSLYAFVDDNLVMQWNSGFNDKHSFGVCARVPVYHKPVGKQPSDNGPLDVLLLIDLHKSVDCPDGSGEVSLDHATFILTWYTGLNVTLCTVQLACFPALWVRSCIRVRNAVQHQSIPCNAHALVRSYTGSLIKSTGFVKVITWWSAVLNWFGWNLLRNKGSSVGD